MILAKSAPCLEAVFTRLILEGALRQFYLILNVGWVILRQYVDTFDRIARLS